MGSGINYAQTKDIKGIVNQYMRVTDFSGNKVTLKNDVSSIFTNLPDTVLIIQMTGITMPVGGDQINNAGRYEFNIVDNVNGNEVTLRSAISSGSFTTTEIIQMIRVPSYKNVRVIDEITCEPWEWTNGTGGVVALISEGTLSINANIDVSERGFKGGAADDDYNGICSPINGDYIYANFPENSPIRYGGRKGEGAISTSHFDPSSLVPSLANQNRRGFGRLANGGGGGNGQWSGGGGGGNGNSGGNGGNQACGDLGYLSGNYGFSINNSNSDRTFMGGGGGAGTGKGTKGGNGGGIVFIIAQNLEFSANASIKANGESVATTTSNAGAGGGGAGGSILISAVIYDDNNIKAEAIGGKGGNVNAGGGCGAEYGSEGAGGGGGGGIIFTTKNENWYQNNKGRLKLENPNNKGKLENSGACIERSDNGQPGKYLGNFNVRLNGFFLNYILDSNIVLCNDDSETIVASNIPSGNSIKWESSINGKDDWKMVPQSNNKSNLDYTFTENIWLRRVVSSGPMEDNSEPVFVEVFPAIINEIVPLNDNAFCGNQMITINEKTKISGGGSDTYNILWQQSSDGVQWNDLATSENLVNYVLPEEDNVKIYRYRRMVSSSKGCISYAETGDITIQPAITDNIISPEEQIFCGEVPAQPITGSVPKGGDGTISYRWQYQYNNNWDNIPINDGIGQNYLPTFSFQRHYNSEYKYRRYVESGKCKSYSNEVSVRFDDEPLPSAIVTDDMTGNNALRYQFKVELVAEPAAVNSGESPLLSGIWSSNDENLTFFPNDDNKTIVENLKMGENTVYWTVSNGTCASINDSIKIFVTDIFIPSGFSPNDDGINDYFIILGLNPDKEDYSSELTVFDRYNNVVFESKSYIGDPECKYNCKTWWDGKSSSGNDLPSGTYYYWLVINGNRNYKGYVILKR